MSKLLPFLLKLALMAPQVVAGVESLAGSKDSTTKQQMAHNALMLGSGVASVLDPNDQDTIADVSNHVSQLIDGTVSTFNSMGIFTKKPATPAPVPAA